MIYVYLNGRLGNHLFIISAAYTLSIRCNKKITLYVNEDLQITTNSKKNKLGDNISHLNHYLFNLFPISYQLPEFYHLINQCNFNETIDDTENILLSDYFQSTQYINISLINFVQKNNVLIEKLKNMYKDLLMPISIHIRRTDYLNEPLKYLILSKKYYKKALSQFHSNNIYLVFSDDIIFAKKHFIGGKYYFINNTPIEDLYLMSLCSFHIISNSTISWWGAYLNNSLSKTIISPKNWLVDKRSNSELNLFSSTFTLINNEITIAQLF